MMTHARSDQQPHTDHQHHQQPCRCNPGGSWNPHLRGNTCYGGFHQHFTQNPPPSMVVSPDPGHCHGCGCHLGGGYPQNRTSKMGDQRYRSFHNFNQLNSVHPHLAGKSRASWAVPISQSSHGRSSAAHGPVLPSGFMSYPSEMDFTSHPDLVGPIFRRIPNTTSCNCLHSLPFQPAAPLPLVNPHGHFLPHHSHQCLGYATSSFDLTTEQSGSQWHLQQPTRMSNRRNQASQTSENAEKSKSLRWTKEQLKKFDNLIPREPKSTPPLRNGSLSSSSGGALTDDSGIHSRSTSNGKTAKQETEEVKTKVIGRASVSRRPIRKLPAPPKRTGHAQVVKLNTGQDELRKPRSLPICPGKDDLEVKESSVSVRLSNFFRSVKLTKTKKDNSKNVKIFGTDLLELYNCSNEKVPPMLVTCFEFIEKDALVDGVYRISGIASNIKRLKSMFESNSRTDFLFTQDWVRQDIHCVPSLVKLFFRELPEPLCSRETLPLLKKAASIGSLNSDTRDSLPYFKAALSLMRKPHYWTLRHLLLHLQRVANKVSDTGMSSKNLAIVWTPNLLRTPLFLSRPSLSLNEIDDLKISSEFPEGSKMEHPRLQFNLVQNTQIVQYLIENAHTIFQSEQQQPAREKFSVQMDQFQSLNFEPKSSVMVQHPLSRRYVTSFPVEGGSQETTSLPFTKNVGNITEANIVRLSTITNSDENQNQKGHQMNRLSTVINVSGIHRGPQEGLMTSGEIEVPTHHAATHRHIHPVFVMRTVSQV